MHSRPLGWSLGTSGSERQVGNVPDIVSRIRWMIQTPAQCWSTLAASTLSLPASTSTVMIAAPSSSAQADCTRAECPVQSAPVCEKQSLEAGGCVKNYLSMRHACHLIEPHLFMINHRSTGAYCATSAKMEWLLLAEADASC